MQPAVVCSKPIFVLVKEEEEYLIYNVFLLSIDTINCCYADCLLKILLYQGLR